ncbi:MAG: hypothetical protein AB1492_07730 [Bacillota bacterium]
MADPRIEAATRNDLFARYGLAVTACVETHGLHQLETTSGTYCLHVSARREAKVRLAAAVATHVRSHGLLSLPAWIPTLTGEPFVSVSSKEHHVLTGWVAGAPPDFSVPAHITAAAAGLSAFHRAARGFCLPEGLRVRPRWGGLTKILERQIEELAVFRVVARSRASSTSFDRRFLSLADEALAIARAAADRLQASDYSLLTRQAQDDSAVCWRAFSARSMRLAGDEAVLLHTLSARQDAPVVDLIDALDVVGGANAWSPACLDPFLAGYRCSPAELKVAAVVLAFPREFWRLASRYYQNRTEWSERAFVARLEAVVEEDASRRAFAAIVGALAES